MQRCLTVQHWSLLAQIRRLCRGSGFSLIEENI
uniref:Uncharacterized protein n=1 Tax=Arundo donax TaxID=35708 RepID=A0A0A9ATL7_ARUDO